MLPRPPTCDGGLRAFGPSGDGVEAVLACMERHQSNSQVQAVACWSLVNLALIPQQKRALCRQGGVLAIVRAMACHPQDSEVHFRAMFALINLVTPDVTSERIINLDTMKVKNLGLLAFSPKTGLGAISSSSALEAFCWGVLVRLPWKWW